MTRRWSDEQCQDLPENIRRQLEPAPAEQAAANGRRMNRAEQELQIAIVQLADNLNFPEQIWQKCRWLMPPKKVGEFLHHVPNGGGRSKAEGGIFKAMGVRAGYPDLVLDLCVIDGEDVYPGWRCELKVGDDRPRPNQILWHENLRRAGFHVTAARSIEEWGEQLREYLLRGRVLYRGTHRV